MFTVPFFLYLITDTVFSAITLHPFLTERYKITISVTVTVTKVPRLVRQTRKLDQ
jgi:hypothetical protein